ncbi:FxsA family protein [Bacillus andreraoultii]|uniref:FxsA family protein n=1 Tax=Bacillus andreraoultii TaxID=1499685 RepID=UPI00053B91EC|nr:FxsA family protein [Bacillus andreraoultii]
MRILLPIFILLPALEIGVLLISGNTIGIWNTVMVIILTGILGTILLKKEGLEVIRRAQAEIRSGRPPGNAILDGVCVFVGGILLILPGFVTDCFGLLLLLPPTRKMIKPLLIKWIKRWIDRSTIFIMK